MTPAAFDAICTLLQIRESASREAARFVLVNGLTQVVAAERVGITRQGVSNAVSSIRRGLELARVAVGDAGDAADA